MMRTTKTKAEAFDLGLIVYGQENGKKPKAARFSAEQAVLAAKAAAQLNLKTLRIVGPKAAALADKLPVGRIHANGRSFIPFVRSQTFEDIGLIAKRVVRAIAAESKAEVKTGSAHTLPKNWDEITEGSLVIANESDEDGWYRAVVLERRGENLTLRWENFNYPRRFVRHFQSVGLIYTDDYAPKFTKAKNRRNANASAAATNDAGLPASWQDIDLNSLVLVQEDGPWRSYWEGIVTEKNQDGFTLQWRDFPTVSPVIRDRQTLGLLYPRPE